METAYISEMSVILYQTTPCPILEDSTHHMASSLYVAAGLTNPLRDFLRSVGAEDINKVRFLFKICLRCGVTIYFRPYCFLLTSDRLMGAPSGETVELCSWSYQSRTVVPIMRTVAATAMSGLITWISCSIFARESAITSGPETPACV
jgi:hypothetical protein